MKRFCLSLLGCAFALGASVFILGVIAANTLAIAISETVCKMVTYTSAGLGVLLLIVLSLCVLSFYIQVRREVTELVDYCITHFNGDTTSDD